jgi:hypothetical protein
MKYLFLYVYVCSRDLAEWFINVLTGEIPIKPWHYLILPAASVNFYFHISMFLAMKEAKCTRR